MAPHMLEVDVEDNDWHFETLQVHAGLEKSPAYGQCTLPIFNSAAFAFNDSSDMDSAFGTVMAVDQYIYSRVTNPTTDGFEKRIAALEDGVDAASFASGTSAVMIVAMSLARAGDNVIVSNFVHCGTFHQFKLILGQMGIEPRFCNTNDIAAVRQRLDHKTKFIFTESIANPEFSVADLEPLAELAHSHEGGIPVIVDGTFSAAGHFCRPAKWGADIVLHSATKWISGHGTSLGGVVVETGRSNWQANKAKFPQLHGMRPECKGSDSNMFEKIGHRAWMQMLKWNYLRDIGGCLSPYAAQQLFIGVETISLRCERQAHNAVQLAAWLRQHPRVAWVSYLGDEDHPHHKLAVKYLQRGFGTVITFGCKGGAAEGLKLCDAFRLIINTSNVGDAKTLITHHWSTTHNQCTNEERETMGVTEDLFRLSLGIEHIDDIIGDFEQAFRKVVKLMPVDKGTLMV